MSDVLHVEGEEPQTEERPAAPMDLAAQRNAKRMESLRKAQAARKLKAEQRRARKGKRAQVSTGPASDAPPPLDSDDPMMSAVKAQLLEAPITSAKDLAEFLASIEETLAALTPPDGIGAIVRSLEWSNGNAKPSARCTMACGFMWPWMRKHDAFGQLAAHADDVMFIAGLAILGAPLLKPLLAALFARRAAAVTEVPAAAAPAPQPTAFAGVTLQEAA